MSISQLDRCWLMFLPSNDVLPMHFMVFNWLIYSCTSPLLFFIQVFFYLLFKESTVQVKFPH